MYVLPTALDIGGASYPIRNNGDYRMVLDCFAILTDAELSIRERVVACLIVFFDGFTDIDDLMKFSNVEEAVNKMYNFFNCGQDSTGQKNAPKLIDWEQDEQLIMSGVNSVAGKEVRTEPYVHWYTFMGYYMAIGEGTLSTVVGIRNKLIHGKKLEKYENQFKREHPNYFNWNATTVEQQEADNIVKQLWNQNQ